jgi:putative membrane protein
LATGPLLVWLKFGGAGAFNHWFWAKMVLVAVATCSVGVHEWAVGRFKRSDESAGRLMLISGRLTGASMVLIMLCAVFAFN